MITYHKLCIWNYIYIATYFVGRYLGVCLASLNYENGYCGGQYCLLKARYLAVVDYTYLCFDRGR